MTEAITFEPFPSPALSAWIEETRHEYIDERVAAGDSLSEAEENADASIERLFPGGSPAPGQRVGRLVLSGQVIGCLWIGMARSDPERWWVWDVKIEEEFRGQGHGRQAMLLAETLAREEGALTMGLNVFGHNQVARGLYSSLGYDETAVQMRKTL
jgi:ribosomal protein S18 acetylase RimI-like enzyme